MPKEVLDEKEKQALLDLIIKNATENLVSAIMLRYPNFNALPSDLMGLSLVANAYLDVLEAATNE